MSKFAFELDDAAEAEFYDIVNYYMHFPTILFMSLKMQFRG